MNAKTAAGCTPLYFAAAGGFLEASEVLLGAGADVELASNVGCTPVHIAATNGHANVSTGLELCGRGCCAASMPWGHEAGAAKARPRQGGRWFV